MRSLAAFTILFDKPFATHYSGQHVTGRIYVRLIRQKKLQGIELRFSGAAGVQWTEYRTVHRNGRSKKETVHYSSREVYFENNFYILGGPNGEMTLPPGEHYYPFRMILPQVIPSSFEGQFGHVRYTCKAVIFRPWRFNHECKLAFTVLNPLDLNLERNLENPVTYQDELRLCCCCCRSEPVTLDITIGMLGFVPGQKVQGIVEVENPTNTNVTIKCTLTQRVKFTAACETQTQFKIMDRIVAQRRIGELKGRGSLREAVDLKVPSLPDSFLRNCSSMHISYSLQIIGNVAGSNHNMKIEMPIVIGSIPLRRHFYSIVSPAVQAAASPANYQPSPVTPGSDGSVEPSAPPDPFSNYPGVAPPTYEECMSGRGNIRTADDNEYVQGPMEFAPRYPIYIFK